MDLFKEIEIESHVSKKAREEHNIDLSRYETLTKNFMQELFTSKNTVLKPDYGTDLTKSLGDVINPPKFKYFFKQTATQLYNKYEVKNAEVTEISKVGTELKVFIKIDFGTYYVFDVNFEMDWSNKHFTNEPLFE